MEGKKSNGEGSSKQMTIDNIPSAYTRIKKQKWVSECEHMRETKSETTQAKRRM